MQKEVNLGFGVKSKKRLSPEELSDKMAYCTYEFEEANRQLRKIEEDHNFTRQTKHIGSILACKRSDLLKNPVAKERYQICCDDDRFKPTKDIIEDYTFLELDEIATKYSYYHTIADQAKKEYEMWQGQLFRYQSELKFKSAEMMSLGSHRG